jgi:cobaltochelatase CobT
MPEARSAPVTSAALDAVGGCTRALAGTTETDSAFGATDAATLGSLRAFGDRIAVRQRYQDAGVHLASRPSQPVAAAIYDALTLARLDTLGVQWLPGIARNLLAHPGADEGGVRWLAFALFSGREAPADKHAAVERIRAVLSSADATALRGLGSLIRHESQFVESAASWAQSAVKRLHRLVSTDAPPSLPFPLRRSSTDIRRGRYALPGSRRREDTGDARRDDLGSSSNPADDRLGPLSGLDNYHAYTTAFDRVVNAASLATREELALLRRNLEADMAATRAVVARLAKRLMRVLMAKQAREWRFDLDEGLLDASRLAPFVASRGAARPFKQELDSPFPSTAVTLLIDHSGSMRGRPMQIAAMTVEIFARVLERCGVRCEVLGFTTRDWDGGDPAREWAAAGYPENPGRLNALEHIVIKAADVPWRRARIGLGLFLHDEMLKENIDGEALAWAHARLLARPERRRILVVVSDGTPMDEATFAANGYDYLDDHLLSIAGGIETRSPVQLAAIGIGHDVSRFYRNATRIARIDDLGTALTNKLVALMKEE